MVRLKHRYLLINILYPSKVTQSARPEQDAVLDLLQFHAPSPLRLDQRALARLIQDSISELFGDYGTGKSAGSLKGTAHD
jgi:ribonuclease P/MRP protein subunit POP5